MTVSLDTFSVGLIDLIKKKQKIKKFTMCKDKSFRARKNKRQKERIKDSTLKDIRNLFRLNKEIKEIDNTTIKDIRNYFRLKKEKEAIKLE